MAIPDEKVPVDNNEAVTDINEVRDQKEEDLGEPLEGSVREYDTKKAPSELEMSEMERVKDQNAQEQFDKYARGTDRERIRQEESTMMGKLRKFLGLKK